MTGKKYRAAERRDHANGNGKPEKHNNVLKTPGVSKTGQPGFSHT